MYRMIRSVLVLSLVAILVGCEYWNKDMLGYLKYWSETVQLGKVEVSDATIQKNDAGADTIPVAATPTIAVYVVNPQGYGLLAEIGDSSSVDKSVRVSDSAVQSKAQVVAHEPTMLKVQLGSADGSLEHTEFRVDFEAIRKDTMQSSGQVMGVTLRYNTPPVAPTPVVLSYDSSQHEVVKDGETWEADRDGILYWAYDDSITKETDPNCAKWFSINGTRHPVAECKVPDVQVDGLSVFQFKTNYGSISVAAVDSEGVSSPAVASGQAVPPATYVIKYDGNGADGGTAPTSQSKTQYTDITLATNSGGLTRIGYRFTGWNTDPDGTGTTYSAGAAYSADEGVTLYAQWEAVDAVVLTPESGAVNHGATVTLTPPKSDAIIYYQIGGADEVAGTLGQTVTVTLYNASHSPSSATGVAAGIPEGGSVTLTAHAVYADGTKSEETTGTYRLNLYTVLYDGGNKTGGDEPDEQTFYSGGSVTVQGKSDLTKTGYTFAGWNTKAGGTGTPYREGDSYTDDASVTLTAQWDPNTYTVRFYPNGGSYSEAYHTQEFTYDDKENLDGNLFTPPADSEFVGWKGDDDNVYTDGEEVNNLTTVPDGTVILRAQWVRKLEDSAKELSGYTSPHAPSTGSSRYVEFGYWPQSVKADGVTVDTKLSKEVGMFTYYLGSDGNWYVEVTAKPYEDTYTYTYTDGKSVEKDKEVYFKVEPIVWRVLTENYNSTGNALLLAEKILTGGIKWADSGNNYMESNIRKWLNGNSETGENSDYNGTPGFLQTAFTADAQDLIAETDVDNSAASTNPAGALWNNGTNQYACDDTTDKIFLLSQKEASASEYGFAAHNTSGTGNTRIRVTTDYVKATGAYQDNADDYGGWWWLRSPSYFNVNLARGIDYNGFADSSNNVVLYTGGGVVPALCIPVSELP